MRLYHLQVTNHMEPKSLKKKWMPEPCRAAARQEEPWAQGFFLCNHPFRGQRGARGATQNKWNDDAVGGDGSGCGSSDGGDSEGCCSRGEGNAGSTVGARVAGKEIAAATTVAVAWPQEDQDEEEEL